ncbi:MAG: hypothetical protein AB9873_17310 [Syntrophobacteraceae bacterium]
MSDELALFVVLGLVYLTDCLCWTASNTVAFVSAAGARWTHKVRGDLVRTSDGGLVLLNPLPPLGTVFRCHIVPLAVSPEGVSTHNLLGSPTWARDQTVTTIPWDGTGTFEARGRHLLLEGERLVRCEDGRQAEKLCVFLNQLQTADPDDRSPIIDRFWDWQFDLDSARSRLKAAMPRLGEMRILCNGLFLILFGVAPSVVLYGGRVDMLIPMALAMLAIVLWIVIRFNSIFGRLNPGATDERITHLIKMILCPPASIRACDLVTENLLNEHHPLVVAHLLMQPERYAPLAAETYRSLRFPIVPRSEAGYAGPIAWQNERLTRKAEQFLERIGLRAVDLLSPPAPDAPDVQAYCPRCLDQFMEAQGECPDCTGVMRAPFSKGQASREERR